MFPFRSKRQAVMTMPSPDLLQDLFLIGMMKASMSMLQKGLSQKLGFYVQLMTGFKQRTQLQAGDHWRKPCLEVEYQPKPGTAGPWHLTKVKRYLPGEWERLIQPSLELTAWLMLWDKAPVNRIDQAVETYRQNGVWSLATEVERSEIEGLIHSLTASYRRDVQIDADG
ncbi:MAG: hypothetical protein ACRDJE_07925 [Dehalococcoidia bacterium]